MSAKYNGIKSSNTSVQRKTKRAGDFIESNDETTSEADFRGFEKLPLVLCKRLDITPYLNTIKPNVNNIPAISNLNSSKMDKQMKIQQKQIEKILQKCSVTLVRDDLEQLKEMVKNNSPILNGNTSLKCKICYKQYSSDKKLQNHVQNKHIIYKSPSRTPKRVSFSDHIIIHEVKEYHRCRKCPKIFENYNTLKLHMKQKHRKRKCYICHYCSKDFVDRTFFKVHIKLHCDACGLLLLNKKSYAEHRKNVCRIIKKYECKTCHMLFFNFMDLKDHSYEHLGIFFICDICKDQFQTKCAISHHIQFLHSNNRPKLLYMEKNIRLNRVFVCNFCGDSVVEESMMEEHLSNLPDLQNRAMTGYKDYFFCDQCLKMFSTEADMMQHKWSHFLKSNNSDSNNGDKKHVKLTYKIDEKLPDFFKPQVVLHKLELNVQLVPSEPKPATEPIKRAIVDPISKKTIISKYQCENCGKYLSSNYCLNRHMLSVHGITKEDNRDDDDSILQCPMCEETFSWPILLKSHNCIRMAIPHSLENPKANITIDNVNDHTFDNLDIAENEDYMNSVDFDIPAPIVELREYDNVNVLVNGGEDGLNINNNLKVNSLGYKVVIQDVPIEF